MQKIWFKDHSIEEINLIFKTYMTGYLEIKATAIHDDMLVVSMPITDKVKQPFGILHGGASVVLAESVGSVASNLVVDDENMLAWGWKLMQIT